MGVIFNFDLTNMEAFLWSCGWSKEYILVVKKKKEYILKYHHTCTPLPS